MMEIVSQVEDALQVTISDADLRHFRTLGDVRRYVECRAADRVLAAGPSELPPATINGSAAIGES